MICLRTRLYRGTSMMWVVECTCGMWADFFIWSNAITFADMHSRKAHRLGLVRP